MLHQSGIRPDCEPASFGRTLHATLAAADITFGGVYSFARARRLFDNLKAGSVAGFALNF
jgi:hypothetical protein